MITNHPRRATTRARSCEEEILARAPLWLASAAGQSAPWFVTLAVKREIEECARYVAGEHLALVGECDA
jgi:hypothetical protein